VVRFPKRIVNPNQCNGGLPVAALVAAGSQDAAMLTTLAFVALADLACWWAQWANNQERKHLSRGWDEDLVRQSIVLTRALILGAILVMLGLIART
jgi:nicotinamide riboside transporter PnuC